MHIRDILIEEELSQETEKQCVSYGNKEKRVLREKRVEGEIKVILIHLISIENICYQGTALSRACT